MFLSWVGLLLKLTNNILSVSQEKRLLNKLFWNSNSHLRARVFTFISLVMNWTKCILQRCHKVPKCSCFATNNGHFRIICLEGCKNTFIKHQNPFLIKLSIDWFANRLEHIRSSNESFIFTLLIILVLFPPFLPPPPPPPSPPPPRLPHLTGVLRTSWGLAKQNRAALHRGGDWHCSCCLVIKDEEWKANCFKLVFSESM